MGVLIIPDPADPVNLWPKYLVSRKFQLQLLRIFQLYIPFYLILIFQLFSPRISHIPLFFFPKYPVIPKTFNRASMSPCLVSIFVYPFTSLIMYYTNVPV